MGKTWRRVAKDDLRAYGKSPKRKNSDFGSSEGSQRERGKGKAARNQQYRDYKKWED